VNVIRTLVNLNLNRVGWAMLFYPRAA